MSIAALAALPALAAGDAVYHTQHRELEAVSDAPLKKGFVNNIKANGDEEPAGGWLGVLRDPHLGRALVAIHRDPAAPWTVRALATEATMSRASFAARFAATTGMTPMQYVRRHRMSVATSLMRQQGLTPEQTAFAVGYGSVAAFSRAYKRAHGISPARARLGEATRAA